jgi:uncharacterized protein (TIGR04255 family)
VERPADLPEFDRPPVDEVVLGVYFAEIDGYSDLDTVLFWQSVQDEFPRVETRPRLQPIEEPLVRLGPPSPEPAFVIAAGPVAQRTWLINQDDDQVIQIQNDLLLTNWRKRVSPYPRFETLSERFQKAYQAFLISLGARRLPAPAVRLVEVSYVNFVADLDLDRFFRPAGAASLSSTFIDANPEAVAWMSKYLIRSEDGAPFGRLTVECATAFKPETDTIVEGSQLRLTTRFPISGNATPDDLVVLMASGRNTIVQAFADLTTPEAHDHWGLQ